SQLERVGTYFLYKNQALEFVKFGRLENLKFIGLSFLESSSQLKSLNLSGCPNLESVGYYFLFNANPKIVIYCHGEAIKLLIQEARRPKIYPLSDSHSDQELE
ncbi:MAG: hypothetical protein Q8J76_05260, partial [Desulfobulbaceae bacterium]|nr:hypothetical protein [Desulfobulbaceae bacterium]